jgi:hypothetical protein
VKNKTSEKISTAKKFGRMAQVVENLPSTCEVQGSNSRNAKKKKKKTERERVQGEWL